MSVDSNVPSDDVGQSLVLHVIREGLGVVGSLLAPIVLLVLEPLPLLVRSPEAPSLIESVVVVDWRWRKQVIS
jgi:hypothetical protein